MQVGASIWGFYHGKPRETWPSLADAVRSILALDGSLGVEVWASRAMDTPGASGRELDQLVDACREAGFVSVHVRGLFWRWDPAQLRDEIEFTRNVGGRTLVLHPVCFGLRRSTDRLDVQEVRRLGAYAAERGVCLAVENVRDSIWILDRILNEIGTDPLETNVGICIDVGHAHLSKDAGETPVFAYLERYADAIVHLHLHDNAGERDDHLAFGEGTIDWGGVVAALAVGGYSGTAILEVHGSGPPDRAIVRSLRALDAVTRSV
jgi:sugar phosphate isomerase/epimerase